LFEASSARSLLDKLCLGGVCRAPSKNTFCIDLDRIRAERDEAKEDVIHRKDFSELKEGEVPPCQVDSGAFMNDKRWWRIFNHPYQTIERAKATHGNLTRTPVKVPPYSTFAVDLGWPFGPVVRLLILSGQRRSEIAGMHWQEIDFEKRVFTLPKERAKNGAEHAVPLSSAAIAILESVPRIASKTGLVFTTNGKSPVDGFGSAKVRLDASLPGSMPSWVLHDLRRTFASGCARLGIGLPVVEKLLNHTSGSFRGVTGIYQRFDFASEQRAAVETWARYVEALVTGEAAGNVVELATARA
jgi:integrase